MKIEDVILYDGVCILCNKWVSFIIRNDKNKRFKFAPIQSKFASKIINEFGGDTKNIDTIFLIKSNEVYTFLSYRCHVRAKNRRGEWYSAGKTRVNIERSKGNTTWEKKW